MNVICFHNPDEENGYMSNWYPSVFMFGSVEFSSREQYMCIAKRFCFGDELSLHRYLPRMTLPKSKHSVDLYWAMTNNWWNGVRQIIVYEGLLAKFSQNVALQKQLKETGKAVLAECAVKDRIWGIGLSMNDPNRFDRDRWQGQICLAIP